MQTQNILNTAAALSDKETFDDLLCGGSFRLERIVSTGQATPPGEWYDQDRSEWVLLLQGAARLRFENGDAEIGLSPGDCINIPGHCRHRVEWTDPEQTTVWLALFYDEEPSASR